jgi:tetratricopeptide (TPR) repeat protein
MRRLLLSTAVAIVSASMLVFADDAQDCLQQKDPQLRIKGCSEIIRRNPGDAAAYHNRAVAYGQAGDTDRAIADYTKAIEIAPNSAAAYDNRGRAYASKGDYVHAVADVTKARELVTKASARPAAIAPKGPKAAAIEPNAKAGPPQAKTVSQPSNNVAKKSPGDGQPKGAALWDRSRD